MCTNNHIKREKYNLIDVWRYLGQNINFITHNGIEINLSDARYKIMEISHGCCRHCGIEGQFFRRERSKNPKDYNSKWNKWHLNLYAIDKKGREVLMTQDHIIPLSRGGSDSLDNLQLLCYRCNQNKGDKL